MTSPVARFLIRAYISFDTQDSTKEKAAEEKATDQPTGRARRTLTGPSVADRFDPFAKTLTSTSVADPFDPFAKKRKAGIQDAEVKVAKAIKKEQNSRP